MGTDHTGPVTFAGRATFPPVGQWDTPVEYRIECQYANGLSMQVGSRRYFPLGIRFHG